MARHHHGAKGGRRHQELLYDPEVATPTHAELARTLASAVGTGTLCTVSSEGDGHPYGSFVTYGLDEGAPVFLVSVLAEHTKNLQGDARCSLLVAQPGEGDPLARPRVTLVGKAQQLDRGTASEAARAAFLAAHPNASYYVDFTDFSFWRMGVESLRYIGGYGRMSWVEAGDWQAAEADPIAPAAHRIISHMNDDHADTMVLYCRALSRAGDTSSATMVSVDRYGFEMSAVTEKGPRPIRLAFSRPIATAKEARQELVALAKQAREG